MEKKRKNMNTVIFNYFANSVNYIQFTQNTVPDLYLLALLNSSVLNFYFSKFSTNSNVNGYEVDALPIAIATPEQQRSIIALVNRILTLKQADPAADITALESELDKLVVELYRHRV